MDETPLDFDMLANKMVNVKGVKTVLIKGTGHERWMVFLSCMADGMKLRWMVIFMHKNLKLISLQVYLPIFTKKDIWMMKVSNI